MAKLNERETNKTALVVGTLIGLLIVAAAAAAVIMMGSKPEIRDFDDLTKIPGGVFPYQDEGDTEVQEFFIGRHEVTISQYAEFLDFVAKQPGQKPNPFVMLISPEGKKDYTPEKWAQIYKAAMKGGKFIGAVDPNCPVVGVDWWDAYAYAKWAGGSTANRAGVGKSSAGPCRERLSLGE